MVPAIAAVLTLITSNVSAKTSYSSGYTGRPPSESCGGCHKGGTAPTIALTGPDTLNAGQSAEYTAVVSGGPNTKTFGAAVDGKAAISPVGSNMKNASGEVFSTHDNGASITFKFNVVAPTSAASFTLYYMALASNGSGTGGDGNVQMTKSITVAGAPTDAGAPIDSGTAADGGSSPADGGTLPTADGGDDPKSNTSDDIGESERADAGADGANPDDGILPDNSSSGCSIAHTPEMSGIAAMPLVFGLAFAFRRRFSRRQR